MILRASAIFYTWERATLAVRTDRSCIFVLEFDRNLPSLSQEWICIGDVEKGVLILRNCLWKINFIVRYLTLEEQIQPFKTFGRKSTHKNNKQATRNKQSKNTLGNQMQICFPENH